MYEKPLGLIIPCYNAAKTLPACLKSVEDQTIGMDSLHVILVDDASTDEGRTLSLLHDFEKKYPDSVTVIPLETNQKQGGARNAALSRVDTEYLQFLDADDTLSENACLELLTQIDSELADVLLFGHNMEEDDFRIDLPNDEARRIFLSSHAWNNNHSSKVYRSELILNNQLRFAAGRYYEEPLFVYPVWFYATRILFARRDFYHLGSNEQGTMVSKAASHLMDHPSVQLELLSFLKSRSFLPGFHDEIEEYFLWTYYLETIVNASISPDYFTLDDFRDLCKVCKREFPEWEENPYLKELPPAARKILSTMNETPSAPEELNALLSEVKNLTAAFQPN